MAEPAYRVKQIDFKGRRVPIMLQDLNGPCPLLAIANVLLLRNQLQLPAGVGEVSQGRLVQMVAGHLLDANSLEGRRLAALSEEQQASLQHNLSDAIARLPKLTTGIDVNLRFHDIAGFEFTDETSVFDLMDIPLVHGWLVDPQDGPTARAVGSKSYNELVVQLATALGSAATPKQLTPSASLRAQTSGEGQFSLTPGGSFNATPAGAGGLAAAASAAAAAAAAAGAGGSAAPGTRQQAQHVDAATLSAALQHSLRLSLLQQHDSEGSGSGSASATSAGAAGALLSLQESCRAHSNVSMQTADSMHSHVNRMLADLVSDAFTSPSCATPTASRTSGLLLAIGGGGSTAAGASSGYDEQLEGQGRGGEEVEEEEATSQLRPGSDRGSSGTLWAAGGAPSAAAAAGGAGAAAMALSSPVLSGSLEWQAELNLCVDDDGGGDDGAAVERPVRVQLVLRQQQLQQPPLMLSPFDSGRSSELGQALPLQGEEQQADLGSGSFMASSSMPATPHASAASVLPDDLQQQQREQQQAGGAPAAAAAAGAAAGGRGGSPGSLANPAAAAGAAGSLTDSRESAAAGEAALRDALLVQQFLEGSPSQLTYHGLLALQDGLRPSQLAVFFRNNHFNTMYKGEANQLFILVTDEGFQFESDVVWEQLISVDGDTQLVGANFRPFQPHATQQQAQERQAAAQDVEWEAAAAAAAASGGHSHDADLALAMQLQGEEEERVRVEQQRRQQQMARQKEEQRRQGGQQQQQQQGDRQQQLPSQQQRRTSSGSQAASGGASEARKKKDKKPSDSSCSIM